HVERLLSGPESARSRLPGRQQACRREGVRASDGSPAGGWPGLRGPTRWCAGPSRNGGPTALRFEKRGTNGVRQPEVGAAARTCLRASRLRERSWKPSSCPRRGGTARAIALHFTTIGILERIAQGREVANWS